MGEKTHSVMIKSFIPPAIYFYLAGFLRLNSALHEVKINKLGTMKTVKIKVKPTADSLALIPGYLKELEWLWNWCRRVALHNQCLDWYKWAEGKMAIDLDGCIHTSLYFGRRSVYYGASCRIAVGGPRWVKDESVTIPFRIKRKGKWEERTKHGSKLIDSDRPYEPITPITHTYLNPRGKELKRVNDLDKKGMLSGMRADENLPAMTIHSDYIGGLIADFEGAWKAYCDPKLSQRHQPQYRDGKRSSIKSLGNPQHPPKVEPNKFVCAGLSMKPIDSTWEKRLGDMSPRSYKLVKRASGWYLCISVATPNEVIAPTLKKRRDKAATAAKKGVVGKQAIARALAESPEYQAANDLLLENKMQIEIDRYLESPCSKLTGKSTGIDPGVKNIVATDHGALFRPNISRGRIALHIESMQSRLDGMRESNDRRLGASWRMGRRDATNNEVKLARKISRLHERGSNSSNMFNHKLATRLARTYDAIYWENSQLANMSKGVEPKLSDDGTHYEKNGAAAKTGLNYAIRHACMGDLKSKSKQRIDSARKVFKDVPAPNSSQTCHCCGEKGDRAKQDTFFCLNSSCTLHLVKQNADINAANNHKQNGMKD
jgi:hypothetical protein